MDFSIISVTHNCEKTIQRCVGSAMLQEKVSLEHIVVDGSSQDSTYKQILELKHSGMVHISEPDSGIYEALNKGIQMSSGNFIGVLHCDDVFFEAESLLYIKSVFQKHPNINMVSGGVIFKSTKNDKRVLRCYRSHLFRPWMLRFGFMPAHTATFIRSDVLRALDGYNDSYESAGDFDFFVRYFNSPYVNYLLTDKVITIMEIGGKSTSGIKSYNNTSREILRSLKENNVFSLTLFVLVRLPIKWASKFFFGLFCDWRYQKKV